MTKNPWTISPALLLLASLASAAPARALAPNDDPDARFQTALEESRPAAALRLGLIRAVPVVADDFPYPGLLEDRQNMGVWAVLAKTGDAVEAIFSVCDETIDDCSGRIFVFPELKADRARRRVTFHGRVVGVLTPVSGRIEDPDFDRSFTINWTGYHLGWEFFGEKKDQPRVAVFLEKSR